MKEKESQIVAAICEYLTLRGVFFYRQNNVPVFSEGRFRALPKYTPRGLPDIVVVKEGRYIGLECKTKAGRQSDHQRAFASLLEANGGVYGLVTGIEDVQGLGL